MGAEEHPLAARLHAASWSHVLSTTDAIGRVPWSLTATEPDGGIIAQLHGDTSDLEGAGGLLAVIVAEHEAATAPKRLTGRVKLGRALCLLLLVLLLAAIWLGDARWFLTALLTAAVLGFVMAPGWAEAKTELEAQKASKAAGS